MPRAFPAELDAESMRLDLERELLRRFRRELGTWSAAPADYEVARREWLCTSLRLTASQAPRAARLAEAVRQHFGLRRAIEVYQRSQDGLHLNAITARADDGPILVQLHGPILERLDDDGVLALLGHEIGHHLAHGPRSVGGIDPFFVYRALQRDRRVGYRELASAYCRAAEITADRVGLLACRNVDAVVRMQGHLGGADARDPESLVRDARAYAEDLLRHRRRGGGDSHPEMAVRVYAILLFAETTVYEELTGEGPGVRSLAEVDHAVARLIGPSESADDMGLPPEGERPLLDRARGLLADVQERARAAVVARVSPSPAPQEREEEAALLDEVDRDPLEEKFAALEQEIEARSRAALEARFAKTEGR